MCFVFLSCSESKEKKNIAPWGETVDNTETSGYDLDNIESNGELIMLTLNGPQTYYDYHGKALGTEFMLCERFAQSEGVSLRVEVCKDTLELVRRLFRNDADIIAFPLPKNIRGYKNLVFCGAGIDSLNIQWAVRKNSPQLAKALDEWYKPKMRKDVKDEEIFLLSSRSIRRHIYAPMLNRKNGIISRYDGMFMSYSMEISWDWRLMAAQCYQESCFDPNATSWAGACGLMQIMPGTAAHLGLPVSHIYDPEQNIAASARYIADLSNKFRDVQDRYERVNYVLACYNGGYYHIRDAMSLARKYGKNQYLWSDVSQFVLLLSQPKYYNDPAVRHGYMRGSETVDYVARIKQRWNQYRTTVHSSRLGIPVNPHRARHKNKYKL